ncbi:MAG: transglutaminase domain-containing protein [Gemmataceae bacterium]|nr:transglutaminase domain-containing protein [Gemmataceae bacterium]
MTYYCRGTVLNTVLFLVTTCIAHSASAAFAQAQALDPDLPYQGAKTDAVTFQVDLSAVVTPPYKCKVLKVWMPIPPTDAAQEVSKSAFSSFPMKVEPKIGAEKTYGNRFAYFEFHHPQGAQIVRHQFQVKTWQIDWNVDFAKVQKVERWPSAFDPYLRGERLVPVDERFGQLAMAIVPKKSNAAQDMAKVMDWVNDTLVFSHQECSLQGSAIHALEKRTGHCSDYHGLCTALGRNLGYPTRIVYGINPYPKNSPSHCKLEAYLPPYGWVAFDVSDTQNLIAKIRKDDKLDDVRRIRLVATARDRLVKGFRDNTWFLQTRGSGYDLEPPAKEKVAVVRTIYAEADGVAYAEPDPANLKQSAFSWMTVHHYSADRQVTNPFQDWRSLEK